jgi:hypothetical protein
MKHTDFGDFLKIGTGYFAAYILEYLIGHLWGIPMGLTYKRIDFYKLNLEWRLIDIYQYLGREFHCERLAFAYVLHFNLHIVNHDNMSGVRICDCFHRKFLKVRSDGLKIAHSMDSFLR